MKSLFTLTIVSFLAIQSAFSQATPKPELCLLCERINIKDVGSMDIPISMEVKKGKYKESVNASTKEITYNELVMSIAIIGCDVEGFAAVKKCPRVVIETEIGDKKDYEVLYSNFSNYTQKRKDEINTGFFEDVETSHKSSGLTVANWKPMVIGQVNGMACFVANYVRVFPDGKRIVVKMLMFANNDRMHTFTFTCPESDVATWSTVFDDVIDSIRLIPVE